MSENLIELVEAAEHYDGLRGKDRRCEVLAHEVADNLSDRRPLTRDILKPFGFQVRDDVGYLDIGRHQVQVDCYGVHEVRLGCEVQFIPSVGALRSLLMWLTLENETKP